MTAPGNDDGDIRFADWVDGRMSERERERFEAELRVNPALRERAERYRRTVETVQRALRQPVPGQSLADSVLARIEQGAAAVPRSAGPLPWRSASRRALWWSAAVAASVFALLALLIEWQPTPERVEVADAPIVSLFDEGFGAVADEDAAGPPVRTKAEAPSALGEAKAVSAGAADDADGAESFDREVVRSRQVLPGSDPASPAVPFEPPAEADRAEGREGAGLAASAPAPGADALTSPENRRGAPPSPGVVAEPFRSDTWTREDDVQVQRDSAAQLQQRLEDYLARAGTLRTAQTMLPQVHLMRANTDGAGDQGRQAGIAFDTERAVRRFLAQDQDESASFYLGAARPAPSDLRVQELILPPHVIGNRVVEVDQDAWLVEGPGPVVFQWLSQLAEVGRLVGYDIANSEVPTADVMAMLPAPMGQNALSLLTQRERSTGETGAAGSADEPAAGAPDASPTAQGPSAQGPSSPGPGGRANPSSETAKPGAAPAAQPVPGIRADAGSDAETLQRLAKDDAARAQKSAVGATRTGVPPTELTEREAGAAPAPPVRLVIVVDRVQPATPPVPEAKPAQDPAPAAEEPSRDRSREGRDRR
ncbi:MAG: hypothetical protein AB7O97_15435 [Planctomycetota bacterium]